MQQYGIAQEIDAADRAINAQDFDKVAACYTEDAALVVKPGSEFSSQRDAIYVYRKDESGKWLCAIDNSYGFELLNTDAVK